jgi:hypothetical protein
MEIEQALLTVVFFKPRFHIAAGILFTLAIFRY